MAYKLPNPERERTERNRELKRLRNPDEEDRVERAAALMLVFHEERDINHVMELAQIVIDAADEVVDDEDRMERLAMLANVGRWIESSPLENAARDRGVTVAADWCAQVNDEIDRAERFSVVERRFDAEVRKAVQAALA